MHKSDGALISWLDIPMALALLTRLPIPIDTDDAAARGAGASWAYPVAGALIGLFLATCIPLLLMTGLPGGMVAALILAISVVITGAMHEDGLADSADGLWGGWDRERRLAIMKDSHIGTYGVLALGFSLLIRWLALVAIVATGHYWSVLIAIATLSRLAMVIVMGVLPPARAGGLSHRVGRPGVPTMVLALIPGLAIVLASATFGLLAAAILTTLGCALIARAKIGGQTGDILGATQQVTEMVLLMVAVAGLS